MKRFLPSIAWAMTGLVFLSMALYAFIKASDANKSAAMAAEQKRLAEEYYQKAEVQSRLATEMAARFTREQIRSESLLQELRDCEGN